MISSLYRCAACGSPNVVQTTENSGYSYSKGLFGAALFGSGGAAAGINGRSRTVYKCPNCGLTLDEPMPHTIKNVIDRFLLFPSLRETGIKIEGIAGVDDHWDWDFFVRKYPNMDPDGSYTSSKSDFINNQYTPEQDNSDDFYTYDDYIALLDERDFLALKKIDFDNSRYDKEYLSKFIIGFLKKNLNRYVPSSEIRSYAGGRI